MIDQATPPNRINTKKTTPKHISKSAKKNQHKNTILKVARKIENLKNQNLSLPRLNDLSSQAVDWIRNCTPQSVFQGWRPSFQKCTIRVLSERLRSTIVPLHLMGTILLKKKLTWHLLKWQGKLNSTLLYKGYSNRGERSDSFPNERTSEDWKPSNGVRRGQWVENY